MEKIQKALAKARSARDGTQAPAQAPARATTTVAPKRAAGPDEAWRALKEFHPDPEHMQAARIVTLSGMKEAVPFDVMRTKTLQTMRANNWRRLAITSPTPACGKSTISLNLAFSMSRQSEQRTILAELDLRRPSIGKALGLRAPGGIDQVMQGEMPFAEQALCYNRNLALSLSTGSVPDSAELLQSAAVPDVLSAIEAEYDPALMIFDMPPMMVSDDMMSFASQVDCVLLIAAAESTTIKEIDMCERELASQTNVMGVALNKCRFVGKEHGYGYSYYS